MLDDVFDVLMRFGPILMVLVALGLFAVVLAGLWRLFWWLI